MEPGERLPSEPELSRQIGVSRATLREAMRIFETQGLIHRRQGSGTFVSRPSKVIESGLELLESIETLANRSGCLFRLMRSRLSARLATRQESAKLEIPDDKPGDQYFTCTLAENKPAAYLIDVLPFEILTPEDIEGEFNGSVLDFLMQRNVPSQSARARDPCGDSQL
jgi:GntR family transcriptional regulator